MLHAQARATKQMAIANLKKVETLQDQVALTLFTMPMEDGLSKQAKEYLKLRCNEAENRMAEQEAFKHERVMRDCGKEGS